MFSKTNLLPEEFEDGIPPEILEELPEKLREGYENGHPEYTDSYERDFEETVLPDLVKAIAQRGSG